MKNLTLLLFLLACLTGINTHAQTTLTAGDIAFTGFNSDSPDAFSFVLLTNVSAGTVINFTDCGWNDGSPGAFSCLGGESTTPLTWTVAAGGLLCGTEITITGALASAGLISGTALNFSNLADQVFAFQGTFASPTLIAGLSNNVSVTTTDANWDGATTDGNTSALPDELTNGVNAIRLFSGVTSEIDNWQYNCAVTSGDKTTLAAAINNLSNWTSNNGSAFSPLSPACGFSCENACVGANTESFAGYTAGATSFNGPNGEVFNVTGDLQIETSAGLGATCDNNYLSTVEGNGSSTGNIGTITLANASSAFTVSCMKVRLSEDDGATNTSSSGVILVGGIRADGMGTIAAVINSITPGAVGCDGWFHMDLSATAVGLIPMTSFAIQLGAGFDFLAIDQFNYTISCINDSDCDGICDGVDPTDDNSQERGNMAVFDGVDDNMTATNTGLDFAYTDDFTFETWFKTTGQGTLLSREASGVGYRLGITAGGAVQFDLNDGSAGGYDKTTTTTGFNDGNWHHVAASYAGASTGTVSIYVDGVLEAGAENDNKLGALTNAGTLRLASAESADFIACALDEVMIHNTAKTQAEVRLNIHLSLQGICDANIVGSWKFNEAFGTSIADLSGGGATGSLNGGVTLEPSEAAVGLGVSTSHTMNATATTYTTPAADAALSMGLEFATTVPNDEVVVFNLVGHPFGGPPSDPGADNSFDYWIVNNYGVNTGLDGTATFNFADGQVVGTTVTDYKLEKRGSREFGAWTQSNAAASAVNFNPGTNFVSYDNQTSFSQLFPWVLAIANSPLSLDMLDFQAQRESNDVLLTWITANEKFGQSFGVERSQNLEDWKALGQVMGEGSTANQTTKYHWKDEDPGIGGHYYRLKLADQNGEATYSDIRYVEMEAKPVFQYYPNPTNNHLTINAVEEAFGNEQTEVKLVNLLGQEQPIKWKLRTGDRKKIEVDLSLVPQGIYKIRVYSGQQFDTQSIVVK